MALSKAQLKEILSAAGVAEEHVTETVNKILEGHLASIDALRDEINTLKNEAEANKGNDGKNKEAIEKLQKEYADYKAAVEAERARAKKETAYKAALKDANLTEKGMEKALKYADWDKIEVDDDGKLKDAKTHVKAVREEWAEYVNKSGQQGANTATPPGGAGGGTGMTKDDIFKIANPDERQRAIAENHELFGF